MKWLSERTNRDYKKEATNAKLQNYRELEAQRDDLLWPQYSLVI